MPDLLVNLLKLSPPKSISDDAVTIRRAQPFEITPVREFIEKNFSVAWADEISVGFANKPVTVFIATRDGRVIGFAGYECTRKAFFGPTGVDESERRRGIGKALLLLALHGLRDPAIGLGHQCGHSGGASGRRSGAANLVAVAFCRGLALAPETKGQPVVSEHAPFPAASPG